MKAIITGAGSGLGREFAYYLSHLGYQLVLVGRNKMDLEETAKKCQTKTEIYICDLSKRSEVMKLYQKYRKEDIDFLINNAGFGLFGHFYETDLNRELEMIDVNIISLHILTKLFLHKMIERDKGAILNVSSVAGFMPGPQLSTYYSTKNYVLKQTMAINQELKSIKSNVKISALCPGPFSSKFNETAGVKFNNKGKEAYKIAKKGIDKTLKNKMVIIPELKWKLILFVSKFLPTSIIMKFINNFQSKKQ